MSLLAHIHLHQFFKNKELNHFYIAIAIMSFGVALINIFVPIYLYKIGYSIYNIIFFFFLVSSSFVIFSYSGAKVVSRIGIKHSILFSTPFIVLYFIGLGFLEKYDLLFFILPILLSWYMILYNYGYHLNFVAHSEKNKRGQQISVIRSTTIMMHVLAPLIGGFIASYSFNILYVTGAIILIVGTFPLFLTKENYKKVNFTRRGLFKEIFSKKERGTLASFSGYAIESNIGGIIWPIFIIIILVSIKITGLIIMLSTILSVITFYVMGKYTDKFDKIKLIKLGTLLYFFAWIGRIFANSSFKILAIDSYKNVAQTIIHLPWEVRSYELAATHGYFRFIVSREIIFNLTRVIIMPILILVFFINWNPFIVSFIIAAIASTGYIFINKK